MRVCVTGNGQTADAPSQAPRYWAVIHSSLDFMRAGTCAHIAHAAQRLSPQAQRFSRRLRWQRRLKQERQERTGHMPALRALRPTTVGWAITVGQHIRRSEHMRELEDERGVYAVASEHCRRRVLARCLSRWSAWMVSGNSDA